MWSVSIAQSTRWCGHVSSVQLCPSVIGTTFRYHRRRKVEFKATNERRVRPCCMCFVDVVILAAGTPYIRELPCAFSCPVVSAPSSPPTPYPSPSRSSLIVSTQNRTAVTVQYDTALVRPSRYKKLDPQGSSTSHTKSPSVNEPLLLVRSESLSFAV